MNRQPVVCVIDDDPKILRLVTDILAEEGWEVRNYATASAFLADYQPGLRGCLLLDIQLPGLSGIELQRELVSRGIDIPVVFLTATADVPMTVEVMKHGALDLLQKPFEAETLIAAVRHAVARDQADAAERSTRSLARQRAGRLTPRERQVMDLVARGLANKQVARELGLSDRTVEIHRARVMEKMEVESVADLVRLSMIISIDAPGAGPAA